MAECYIMKAMDNAIAAEVAMKPSIDIPHAAIVDFCRRWNVTEFAFFGSVLRGDFGPHSDIDVLVSFSPGSTPGLLDVVTMRDELEAIFGRKVDILTRAGVENSHNWIRRKEILSTAETYYAA